MYVSPFKKSCFFVCILQERLKITYLAYSVLVEEEIRNREQELKLKLEKMVAHKVRKLEHSNAEGIYCCQLEILLFIRHLNEWQWYSRF